jgi:hypothetical protein
MSDEETPALIAKRINKIAEEICSRSLLGLVHNRPELWAQPAGCFANVIRKVAQDGGRSRFGWTFHHRFVERMCLVPVICLSPIMPFGMRSMVL